MTEMEKEFKQVTGDLALVNLQEQLQILIISIKTLKWSNNCEIGGTVLSENPLKKK